MTDPVCVSDWCDTVCERVYFIFGHSLIMVYVPVLLGTVEVYVEVFYDPHDSRFIWSMMCHWSPC